MEISNFYTVTIYEKGAEIVRMIHTLLGADIFRQGSDLYFSRHDGQAVTIDDFVSTMAEVSGRDFSQFMMWYQKPGTPVLSVKGEYDFKAQIYQLNFKQTCKAPSIEGVKSNSTGPHHIPVKIALVGTQGALPLSNKGEKFLLLELTKEEQTFSFEGIKEQPVPSLLQGFSAPVKLNYSYTSEDLATLMSRDSDGFNRWNASQRLSTDLMAPMQLEYRESRHLELNQSLCDAFSSVIKDPGDDLAMQALVLTLPSESTMAELSEEIDVEAIHAVRTFMLRELGKNMTNQWQDLYFDNLGSGPYVHNGKEVGRRSLKNLALRYLSNAKTDDSLQLLTKQITSSDNMTDRLSALATLINDPRPNAINAANELLDQFYDDWKHEPLVLNQWFQLQASCSLPGGLERVEGLVSHSSFDFRNPNKVRSLIGVFCSSNPTNFHSDNGAGYQFLTEQVLSLDKINPQIAARILVPLTRWRRFPQARGESMRAHLDKVVSFNGLSRDTYEIASKSL
ncbi:MAG: aminopeptidase N [Saprospiraceae bacterium]|jgi:aminopeptidase N